MIFSIGSDKSNILKQGGYGEEYSNCNSTNQYKQLWIFDLISLKRIEVILLVISKQFSKLDVDSGTLNDCL